MIVDIAIGLAKEAHFIATSRIKMRTPVPENWKDGELGNVILLPGLGDNYYFMREIGDQLNKSGYRIHNIEKFNTTFYNIERLASRLVNYINSHDIDNAILIGHSKGGLVAKFAVDHYPSINPKVIKIFTISTPYNGTIFAKFFSFSLFKEFRPGCDMLCRLREETESNSQIINIYPKFDNVIYPNSSMKLDTALVNVEVNYVGHTGILRSPETILQIKSHLGC